MVPHSALARRGARARADRAWGRVSLSGCCIVGCLRTGRHTLPPRDDECQADRPPTGQIGRTPGFAARSPAGSPSSSVLLHRR